MNKKIYIILSYTGTILSRAVKLWTRKKYSHASISLDEKLEEMYSFGRTNPYNPFYGSFVHESPKWGTLKRFKNTKSIIISLEVSSKQYYKIKDEINFFKSKGSKYYTFNRLGIIYAGFGKDKKKINGYYCSEFVKHLLDKAEIMHNLKNPVQPMNFLELDNIKIVYEGKLRDYIEK